MQLLSDSVLVPQDIELNVLRLDQFAEPVSGNKYFKLKYNIEFAKANGYQQLLSFGGAFSNHIHALAMAGQVYGIKTIGLIRGEPGPQQSATLQDAATAGMELHYLSRERYKLRHDPVFLAELKTLYPDAFIIPEGGSNDLGVKGCIEIVDHIRQHLNNDFDIVCLPCGTAATLAGVAAGLNASQQVLGFSVLKNAHYLDTEVKRYLAHLALNNKSQNWQILHQYHCGGYAKASTELAVFIEQFEHRFNIPLEPIYSGKMFFGLHQLLLASSPVIPRGSRVVAIHTGGLQGLRGMQSTLQRLRSNR
ncbi:MAG: pyridoxal-phosphate dependent enzyme [Spongiibacteraceae bacterium]